MNVTVDDRPRAIVTESLHTLVIHLNSHSSFKACSLEAKIQSTCSGKEAYQSFWFWFRLHTTQKNTLPLMPRQLSLHTHS